MRFFWTYESSARCLPTGAMRGQQRKVTHTRRSTHRIPGLSVTQTSALLWFQASAKHSGGRGGLLETETVGLLHSGSANSVHGGRPAASPETRPSYRCLLGLVGPRAHAGVLKLGSTSDHICSPCHICRQHLKTGAARAHSEGDTTDLRFCHTGSVCSPTLGAYSLCIIRRCPRREELAPGYRRHQGRARLPTRPITPQGQEGGMD